jgi:hypothetical protein
LGHFLPHHRVAMPSVKNDPKTRQNQHISPFRYGFNCRF